MSKVRRKLYKTDILVFRNSLHGIKNSRPCADCLETMKQIGIRRVYYSSNSGEIICEKVSQMVSNHHSKMSRHLRGDF